MNKEEIIHYFSVSNDTKLSLREQLHQKLAIFIQTSEPGTLLPPERQLQEALGISRVTVRNAIMPFCRNGQLIRNSSQGTRIAPRRPHQHAQAVPEDAINQMAMGAVDAPQKKVLTLALYENIPAQKDFWDYAVNSFNALYPQHQIAIQWVPCHISYTDYNAYLEETKPDIFQSDDTSSASFPTHPLPASWGKEFREEPDFYPNLISGNSLAFGYTTSMTYWNQDLAKQVGLKDIRSQLAQGRYYELLHEASQKLPSGIRLSGHVWDYFALRVASANPRDLDRPQLEDMLRELQAFQDPSQAFAVSQQDPYDAVRNFTAGQQLFLTVLPATWQAYLSQADFDWEACPILLPTPGSLHAHPLYISIAASSHHATASERFLKHLLSDNIQSQLILKRDIIPVKTSIWNHVAPQRYGLSLKQAQAFSRQLHPSPIHPLRAFLIYAIRDDLADLLVRGIDATIVADQICMKWKQFMAVQA